MDKNNGQCNLYKLFIILNFRIVTKITIKLYELLRRKQKNVNLIIQNLQKDIDEKWVKMYDQ